MSENTQETQSIQANFDNKVDVKSYKFNFKKVKDEAGNETKRLSIELPLKVPSVEGLIEIIEQGGKGLELLIQAAEDLVVAQARSILTDNESLTADNFPFDQCLWQAIANMPEAEKRGRGIPKESWEEFGADYLAVMPGVTGSSIEAVALAVKLFLNKLASIRTNKPVIQKLKEKLTVYVENSPNAEQHYEVVKFLVEKADTFLNADSTATLLANLD